MTLPTDLILPKPTDFKAEDSKDYLQTLVRELESMYQKIAQNVNGAFRNDALVDSSQWYPEIFGESTAGTTTYTGQYGWVLRSGILTDVWFDVSWSATTATGNLYIELPYIVALSNGNPFAGTLQASSIALTSGYTQVGCNAITSTYELEIWQSGSGSAIAKLSVPASGRLVGHCKYVGTADE